ncbi:putative wall-associated receptor kinase-like 16 [Fagus crenata]
MGLHGMLIQITLIGVIISAIVVAAAEAALAKPGCHDKCGDVEIPFPFGLTKGCYRDDDFHITCDDHVAKTGSLTVTNISIEVHEMRVLSYVARDCYNLTSEYAGGEEESSAWLRTGMFTISKTKNKFTVIGCDTYGFLSGDQNGETSWTGCMSLCKSLRNVVNGSCSGVGCCEVEFPDGLKYITTEVGSYYNHTDVSEFNPCGYAFVVEQGQFNFSSVYLHNFSNEMVPTVFDWAIGNETCKKARDETNFACKGNSECYDLQTRSGYHCKCKQGYQGNPYLHNGCQDINECEDPTLNNCTRAKNCVNTEGSYNCRCPKWHHGNGRKDSEGCVADLLLVLEIAIGIIFGLLILLMGGSWIYWGLKRRKLMKLKEKFFQQNGGILLQQQLSNHRGFVETTKIFSSEELKKATNNYDESRVLGQGGYGTVYEGVLPNNKLVAIKKSKIGNQSQIDQFINEIIVLTQINHKNVVQLLGCCLETEVPLLVYEFITNGTLSHHIHNKDLSSVLSWEKRLKILAETAGALAYMHSETVVPIIHRDIKTANILLDDNFIAKVADFGASRLVPLDQTQLTTLVQGTFGYLDPEYFHSSQLTEKSDVYSFGVVMAELLTGRMAFSFDMPESDRNLAPYFSSAVKEDRLLQILEDHIVNEGNIEQIKEVANLAQRCLKVRGEDRPSMKEVAMELEGLVIMEKHPWGNANVYTEETEYLLSAPTQSFNIDVGTCCSTSTTAAYNSMKNEVLKSLNDGR